MQPINTYYYVQTSKRSLVYLIIRLPWKFGDLYAATL
jgi:hypothetical protein